MGGLYYHHFPSRPPTTILRHTLQRLLHFTHPSITYAQNYFRNSLPKNGVSTSVQSYIHITYLSHISLIPNSFTLSHLTQCVKTMPFTAHNSIHAYPLVGILTFFSKGVKQISSSTLTHVSRI